MAKKPVVLIVMDGVGLVETVEGNAVAQAHTPNLDRLMETVPNTTLKAHGLAVGLPTDDDMGNSEVGHNALGAGQIYSQGAKLVNQSIETGDLFKSAAWTLLTKELPAENTLHLIGLLSDGNVHAHVDHVKALIVNAKESGVKRVALHALQDGRDVEQQSALTYIDAIQEVMDSLNDDSFHAEFASGGGRMLVTMDRYDADWPMVERGWHAHVLGNGQMFESARAAIEHFRAEDPKLSDQYIPAWVVAKDGKAVAPIVDNDSVILFNFRGDRAIEISKTFEADASFDKFDRVRVPNVRFAGMLQYDGDLKIPATFLVEPPQISNTLTETLIENNMSSFAISETQKYGHVTYFWNGNKSGKFSEELETFVEIKGDDVTFDQRPWMKSGEITDEVIKAIESGKYDFIRVNYPNGDMVGHTGDMLATIISIEAVDLAIGRLLPVVDKAGATLVVLADHGNADEMIDAKGNPKTSHSLNPVPFIVYGQDVELKKDAEYGLANVAATVADLLGIEANPVWEPSLIKK